MLKSFEQQRLEQRHNGKEVRQIIVDTLEEFKGQPQLISKAAVKLEVSGQTLRNWCDAMEIDIAGYQRANDA